MKKGTSAIHGATFFIDAATCKNKKKFLRSKINFSPRRKIV
jgi:hypothetical protein